MNEANLYHYRAVVVAVTDGDTVVVDIDLGLRIWARKQVLRLEGVAAPETRTPEGREAKAWLAAELPVGTPVIVRTKKDRREKYGRWLASINVGSVDLMGLLQQKWPVVNGGR